MASMGCSRGWGHLDMMRGGSMGALLGYVMSIYDYGLLRDIAMESGRPGIGNVWRI